MPSISYFSEETNFQLPQKRKVSQWIKNTISEEGFSLELLNIIFCTDEYLLQINRDYLDHDYYTDIITFSQAEDSHYIEGDIFISIDRLRENAATLNVEFLQELHRVVIHGVLHLCGFEDHSEQQRNNMRTKEDYYLSLWHNI